MSSPRKIYLAVALGSGLGATARYGISLLLLQAGPTSFPWATLLVNVVGSFVIGFVYVLTGPEGRILARPTTRQFVMAGFCGGLTTFSIFSLETVVLATEGEVVLAAGYVVLSLIAWVLSAWVGNACARHLNLVRPGVAP